VAIEGRAHASASAEIAAATPALITRFTHRFIVMPLLYRFGWRQRNRALRAMGQKL
jgi:hypothetical protein